MISSSVHRAPSPDSACEQDWAPCGRNETLTGEGSASSFSTSEDITSDLSEASSHSSSSLSQQNLSEVRASENVQSGMPLKASVVKGQPGQDSDVDSGIVTCRRHGQRIGSTSSADTDSSQETTSRKSKCSLEGSQELPFWNNIKLQYKAKNNHSSGPVKADHTALKECNRRPPTPLSVLQDSLHQQVRFDDELHLSEQNIRRSCKKLFATLYAQRLSDPNQQYNATASRGRLSLPTNSVAPDFVRPRSRTLPECDLIPQRSVSLSLCPTSYSQSHNSGLEDKENRLNLRATTNILSKDTCNRSAFPSKNGMTLYGKLNISNRLNRLENAEQAIANHLNQTQSNIPREHFNKIPSESLSSPCTHSLHSSSSIHKHLSNKALFKSRSCSTLVNPQLTCDSPHSFIIKDGCHPYVKCTSSCLHKTPSCSNLCNCVHKCENNKQIPFQNSMIMAYARLASVIPDGDEEVLVHNKTDINRQILDDKSCKVMIENCDQNAHVDKSKHQCASDKQENNSHVIICIDNENKTHRAVESYVPSSTNVQTVMDHKLPSNLPSVSQKDQCQRIHEVKEHSYDMNRSELHIPKQKSFSHQQSPLQAPITNQVPSGSQKLPCNGMKHNEVEYAVIDKSKKNRYLSLPSLARVTSHTCIVEGGSDEQEPPVPPKKFMHKSDFALYSSSTSSRKSLFERVQNLTKSAKSALQKAFSTERIYRPEKEERLEATGQKLHRSKSFIKGLKMRMSTRHKKEKLKSTEMLHQTSFSPSWDDPSGASSLSHVWGQLIQLNVDGSQVVELSKPPGKPYGFFVARGRVKNSKGVFVSRMRDQETQKLLAGLLDVGDEILEIDGASVKNADIMEVNNLMSNKSTLLLTVLPYICRKDI